jgi:hypothetical protein
MNKGLHLRFGPDMAVYLIFFALALADAVWVRDWLTTGIFLGVGLLFFVADNLPVRRVPAVARPSQDNRDYPPQIPLF